MSPNTVLILNLVGALTFGLLIGWVTSSVFRRSKRDKITDISAVIGAVAGAAVLALFSSESGAFGVYCVGLVSGFFYYIRRAKDPNSPKWLGDQTRDKSSEPPPPTHRSDPIPPDQK